MHPEDFDVIGRRSVPPDPNVATALASGHRFETALADLVDNSVDAGARHVHIRFVLQDARLLRILIGDDGVGMDEPTIDRAMALGHRNTKGGTALGYFGVGLKAASFSQAEVLVVLSKKDGHAPQGRRLYRHDSAFECEVLDSHQVADAFASPLPSLSARHGTIVRWDGLRHVPVGDRDATDGFVERLRHAATTHLGLVFHRLIDRRQVVVTFDLFDEDEGCAGPTLPVASIDPFGHPLSGRSAYPKTLTAKVQGRSIGFHCHIWPARSEARAFFIRGKNADPLQGLYIYRNDRLISYGGWHGVTTESRRRRLARAWIDVEDCLDLLEMSADKSKAELAPMLREALLNAGDEAGNTFRSYIETAEQMFIKGNRSGSERKKMVKPGSGFDPWVRAAIEEEALFVPGKSFDIRWVEFEPEDDSFVELDRKSQTLWLNVRYRPAVIAGRRGRLNDAPLVKALLYLLFEDVMRGAALGPRDKDNVELWTAILTSAAAAEEAQDE